MVINLSWLASDWIQTAQQGVYSLACWAYCAYQQQCGHAAQPSTRFHYPVPEQQPEAAHAAFARGAQLPAGPAVLQMWRYLHGAHML